MNVLLNKDWPQIEEIPVVEQDQSIAKAMVLIQEGNDIVIIVNESNKFEGILRTRDLVGKGVNPSASCRNYMNRNIPIMLESELGDVTPTIIGKKMIDGGTRFIPVLDNNYKAIGAFKDTTVLVNLISGMEDLDETTAEEVINWEVIYLSETDSIGAAIAKFREFGFSHVPIIDSSNEIAGIVVDRVLLRTHIERRATEGDIGGPRDQNWHLLPVLDFLAPVDFVDQKLALDKLIEKFVKLNLHTLFVKGVETNYGVITTLDIIKYLIEKDITTGFNVIVMQAPDEDIHNHTVKKGLSIMEREQNWLGRACTLRVRFKRNLSQSKRGQFSMTSKLQLVSEKGYTYNATATDFGAEKAVNRALDNLSRIISADKRRRLGQRDRSYTIRKVTDYS